MYLNIAKDTLEEETVSDDLFVSNVSKATPPIYVVFVQDKAIDVNANVHSKNKQVLTVYLVKSLLSSLGAPKVSSI